MTASKPPFLLLNAAANSTGTTFDLGATPGSNQVSYQITAPGTVTAGTVTINGSNDNSTWVPVAAISNTISATGTVRGAPYRYYQAVLASYAGTGKIRVVAEPAYRK